MQGTRNPFVPGFGRLIRKGGMSLDRARELITEAKYIFDAAELTGGVTQSDIATVLRLIEAEARGAKQYRVGHEPAPKIDRDKHRFELERHRGELAEDFDARMAELELTSKVTKKERARALEIMERERETDPLVAYERVLMEIEDAKEAKRRARLEAEKIGDIPGWDVPDDARATPRDGGAAAGEIRGRSGDAGSGGETREAGGGDRGAAEDNGELRGLAVSFH